MRAHAAAFLSDVEASPDSPEAGVAHRAAGMTCWFAGEYREARDHLERALALFQPGRDDDLAFRFGHDAGVAQCLAWRLRHGLSAKSIGRFRSSTVCRRGSRASPHVGTLAVGRMHAALFELMRGDHARVAPNAFELVRLAREHDLTMWRAFGVFLRVGRPRERRASRRARGHAPRRRAAARTERSVVRRTIEDRAGRGRSAGGRSGPRRRDPRRSAGDVSTAPAIARSKRNCIGRAANSC